MRYSTVAKVDTQFRIRTLIESRIRNIQFHLSEVKTSYDQAVVYQHESILRSWLARLDNNHTIQTTWFYERFGSTESHMRKLFQCYLKPTGGSLPASEQVVIDRHLSWLHRRTRAGRISELQFRIKDELAAAYDSGKFVVFNTLTVREGNLDDVFRPRSKFWDTYLTRWSRYTRDHRYIAVVEEGSLKGRLHIHCIHIFSSARSGLLVDPNRHCNVPSYRELKPFCKFWDAGFSSPVMVRFGQDDAFGKLGFRWPVTHVSGNEYAPVEAKHPAALANYVSKYVLKAYEQKERKLWRTRMSRRFGTNRIQQVVKRVRTTTLSKIVRMPDLMRGTHLTKTRLPSVLVEIEATRELMSRMRNRHPMMIGRRLKSLKPRASFVAQLSGLIQGKRDPSWQNTLSSEIRMLSQTDISEIELVIEGVGHLLDVHNRRMLSNGISARTS